MFVSVIVTAAIITAGANSSDRVPVLLGRHNTAAPDAALWANLNGAMPSGTPPPVRDPLTRSFTFKLRQDLTLVPGFSQVKYGRQVISLGRPVIYHDGKLFVPRASIHRIRSLVAQRPERVVQSSTDGFNGLLVVLDPGHGGRDPGAMANGLREKNINLRVAKYLKPILEARKFTVRLTRSDDTFIPLEDRPAFANRINADLFISIHANSEESGTVTGIETYYCDRDARFDPIVRALEAAKRWKLDASKLGLAHEPDGEVTKILYGLLIEDARYRSRKLASAIQLSLVKHVAAESRGTKPGALRVLRHVNCPAVLVETGFMTTRYEAKKLNDPKYQKRLATGIAKGVIAYATAHLAPRKRRRAAGSSP